MKTRVISAAVLIVIVFSCFLLSPVTRILLLLTAAILGTWEICRALSYKDLKCPVWVLYIYILSEVIAIYFDASVLVSFALFFLCAFSLFMFGIAKSDYGAKGTLTGLAVLVYPVLPFIFIMRLAVPETWVPIFALACISTWVCDSFALFGGKWFGKNKLAPLVSPKKTIEGSLTGALASAIAGALLYFALRGSYDYSFLTCVITALLASSFGQVGDLAASLIKRMTGIKDYSNLIPGHGGIMDRVDSLLFSIPTAFFCLNIF